jgi:hypothetical protein
MTPAARCRRAAIPDLAQVVAGTPWPVLVAPVAAPYCCASNPEPADNRTDLPVVAPCCAELLYFLGIRHIAGARCCRSPRDATR